MKFKGIDIKSGAKKTGKLFISAFKAFLDDRALKMSASLAYYTIFSIAPLLIILILLAGVIYGQDAVQGKVFQEVNEFVGNDAAYQIQQIIRRVSVSNSSVLAGIIGVGTLFLGATGVFIEIQDSVNQIWRVKAKPEKGWKRMIINRILSFSMIASLGFLLIVSLIINGIVLALSDRLSQYFPDITVVLVNLFNIVLTFILISVLFGIIFKFLPDVNIGWKNVRMGAFFTALLFMIGRFLIGLYIEKANPGSAYGAAGSLIVILVWVYYTAAILYFGAEFTRAYAEAHSEKIQPASYAVHVVQTEEEKDVNELPPSKVSDEKKK